MQSDICTKKHYTVIYNSLCQQLGSKLLSTGVSQVTLPPKPSGSLQHLLPHAHSFIKKKKSRNCSVFFVFLKKRITLKLNLMSKRITCLANVCRCRHECTGPLSTCRHHRGAHPQKKNCFALPFSSSACFSDNMLLPLSVSSTKPNSTVVLLEAHETLPNSHHVQLAPPLLQPVAQPVFLWLSSLPLWFFH